MCEPVNHSPWEEFELFDEVRVRELGLEAGEGCPDGGELLVKTSALLLSVEQAGERHADPSVLPADQQILDRDRERVAQV